MVEDFNGPDPSGVGGYPVNVIDGVRQNTGLVYLTEEVRNRPNLKISGDVLVDRVLFDGRRAIGVVTASGAEIPAGEVILSGGSYGSPAILLRSGVGPAADLAELGIDVVADLPVGRRLQDQPFYYNAYALKTDALDMRPAVGALLWRQSSEARGDELDMHIAVTHLMPPEYSPTGGAIALSVAVVKPDSRGTLTLRSRDPREQPEIDCNFLAEDRDARRMLEGVKLARRIGRNPALARFLELEILPGDAVGDDQLADVIAANLASYGHPTGTAPMGGPEDPWAVVDSHGAVKGIDGLRVVDASIMPVVPSVALNPTTIMIAERIAKAVYGRPGASRRSVQVARPHESGAGRAGPTRARAPRAARGGIDHVRGPGLGAVILETATTNARPHVWRSARSNGSSEPSGKTSASPTRARCTARRRSSSTASCTAVTSTP